MAIYRISTLYKKYFIASLCLGIASFTNAGALTISGIAHQIQSNWDSGWSSNSPYPNNGVHHGSGIFDLTINWGDPVHVVGDDGLGTGQSEKVWSNYWLAIGLSLNVYTPLAHYQITALPDVFDPSRDIQDHAGYLNFQQVREWFISDELGYHCDDTKLNCPDGSTQLTLNSGISTLFNGYAAINYFDEAGNHIGGDGAGNSPQSMFASNRPTSIQMLGGNPELMSIDEVVSLLLTEQFQEFSLSFIGCISDCSGPYISGTQFVANVPIPSALILFLSSLSTISTFRIYSRKHTN